MNTERSCRWQAVGRWTSAVMILGVGIAAVNTLWDANDDARYRQPDMLGVLLVAAQVVPILWRRRQPWVVLLVVLAATLLLERRGYSRWAGSLCLPFVVFTLAVLDRPSRSAAAAIATGAVLWVALRDEPYISGGTGLAVVLAAVPWVVGVGAGWLGQRCRRRVVVPVG